MEKEIILITKKDALPLLPGIITKNDLCYYLSDDYLYFLKLNKYLPNNCQILNLSGYFQEALRNLRQTFLNLFAELSKKYDSPEWWGTHLASRNSASIPLQLNITYLYCANKILDDSNNRVIFIGESHALLESISRIAREKGYHVIQPRRKIRKAAYSCKLVFLYGYRIVHFILQNLESKKAAFSTLKPLPKRRSDQKKRIVIRTWVTKDAFSKTGEFKDRNFGVLPKWLRSQGYEVWTLPMFFNLDRSLKDMYLLMKSHGEPYLIPDHHLKLTDYLETLYMGFKQLKIPLKDIFMDSMDVTRIFREIQMEQGFNTGMLTLNSYYPLLRRLKESGFEIDEFYYPFENNAPEKIFILGCRRYFPYSRIVAYQHTMWYHDQLGMFLSKDETKIHPIADRIVCSGPIYLNILRDAGFPYEILKLGPNLRFASVYDYKTKDKETNQKKIVLVPLYSDKNQAYELIFKVKAALEKSSDYSVYIRTHPMLSKNDLDKFLSEIEMIDFKFADDGTIQDWLPKSYAVISTGSVVVLESAAMGIPVIRVAPDNTFFYDPLAWSSYPIKPVNSASEIRDNLFLISKMLKENKHIFHEIGKQILFDYFTQVDDNTLKVFLTR